MADIVICDDEPHITRAVALKLRRAGHDVRVAADGREGLDFVAERTPDLVITDCQMPVMNGVELCLELRKLPALRETPVLMLTAKAMELDEDMVRQHLGVAKLLFKPFSPRELAILVDRVLAPAERAVPAPHSAGPSAAAGRPRPSQPAPSPA